MWNSVFDLPENIDLIFLSTFWKDLTKEKLSTELFVMKLKENYESYRYN